VSILLVIIIIVSLGHSANNTTSSNGDQVAQSNLTNALTEAKALYQVNQAYEDAGVPYNAIGFSSQAPEFTWVVGGGPCPTSRANCVSAQVFDVSTHGDSQGVALAVDSPENRCWYAFDIETVPTSPPLEATTTFANSGTYYAYQRGIPEGGCEALNPDTDSGIKFAANTGQSYTNAVSVGVAPSS
jgi:hypothetical protein